MPVTTIAPWFEINTLFVLCYFCWLWKRNSLVAEVGEEIFHLPFSQPPPVIKAVVVGRMSQISHTGPPLLFSLSTEHLLAEWVLIKWSHDGRRWRLGESVTAVELGFVKSFRSKPLQVITLAKEEKLCTEPCRIWIKNYCPIRTTAQTLWEEVAVVARILWKQEETQLELQWDLFSTLTFKAKLNFLCSPLFLFCKVSSKRILNSNYNQIRSVFSTAQHCGLVIDRMFNFIFLTLLMRHGHMRKLFSHLNWKSGSAAFSGHICNHLALLL